MIGNCILMNKQQKRLWFLATFVVLALAFLGFRLFDLQVNRHEELRALAEENTSRTFRLDPMRGQILDIHGTPLATSVPVKVVCANPALFGHCRMQVAQTLAPLLGMTNATGPASFTNLLERLAPRIRKDGKTNTYVVLKRKVPLENWRQIQVAMTNLSFGLNESKLPKKEQKFYGDLRKAGVFSENDQVRRYPNLFLASHVLGYVGYPAKPTNAPTANAGRAMPNAVVAANRVSASTNQDKVELETGLNGIEMVFNSKLTGTPGWRRTELDSRKREILSFRDQDVAPRNGLNVVLTLDAGIQNIVETELAEGMKKNQPISISCIVVRPRTGEILAMATLPNFDANEPGKYPIEALRNRVVCDIAEPGSTFKIVPISAGLNEGIVSLNDVFNCEMGRFAFAGKVLHDAHHGFGDLSVMDIIMKSSNIGAAKVGIRLGEERLYQYIRRYGFGVKTGIPLPGEVPGLVHPTKRWSKVSIAQIPMGHGVAVTPLQTVMAMSAIANNGVLMRPMLVDRLVDGSYEDGLLVAKYQPQVVARVISEQAAKQMVAALKKVPTVDGTAEGAALEHYTVAGKTGTAQKVENGQYVSKFFSSFIGFFPADNPELCISVVMDQPSQNQYYGGKTAGPVFRAIAEQAANYLNLKPDIDPQSDPFSISTTTLATVGSAPGRKPQSGKAAAQ